MPAPPQQETGRLSWIMISSVFLSLLHTAQVFLSMHQSLSMTVREHSCIQIEAVSRFRRDNKDISLANPAFIPCNGRAYASILHA